MHGPYGQPGMQHPPQMGHQHHMGPGMNQQMGHQHHVGPGMQGPRNAWTSSLNSPDEIMI